MIPLRRPALPVLLGLACALTLHVAPTAQAAETSPWFNLDSLSRPGYLPAEPGATGQVIATATNVGDGPAEGAATPLQITDTLPAGVKATSAKLLPYSLGGVTPPSIPCPLASAHLVRCEFTGTLTPFKPIEVIIGVTVQEGAASGEENEVALAGAGAPPVHFAHSLTFSESPTPFGVSDYRLSAEEEGGEAGRQSGSHPFQLTTTVSLNQVLAPDYKASGALVPAPAGLPKDFDFKLPAGLIGNATSYPRCTLAQFLNFSEAFLPEANECPLGSVVGVASLLVNEPEGGDGHGEIPFVTPIFNLTAAHGEPARFGFEPIKGIPVLLDTSLRAGNGEDYGVDVHVHNTTQEAGLLFSSTTFWGTPADPRHDSLRGTYCISESEGRPASEHGACPRGGESHPAPFLALPTSCAAPPATSLEADSWEHPADVETVNPSEALPSLIGCGRLTFQPEVAAEPTSDAATTGTGFDFELGFHDEGLKNAEGMVESQTKKTVVNLPQGFTANPSLAAGLKACSQREYEETKLESGGCTEESKIGEITIESPLVEPKVQGGLFVAKQGENPYGNLLTLYLIARNPELGVMVRQALKVTPDPVTGQLTTEVDNIPQLPFSKFHLQFRSGQRSPLITPPSCDSNPSEPGDQPFTVNALLSPWSVPNSAVPRESSFQITQGPEGLPCPSGGLPPFKPELIAGSQNNFAGHYSPFYIRISRKDSEQEITHFSIKLPPGVVGKLAGIPLCTDAQIQAAKAREHPGGGAEEKQSPSCPQASEVGHTLVGTGVGNVLAYAPGKVYLSGPYNGAPLSVAAITDAVVGPFDLGTVVVREALKVNPETGEVFVDATGSDPIPHIVAGIPVHLRDIRVYMNRPEFVLNPTSCEETSTASTVLGAGLNFASEADDVPVTVTSPFQAADCAALPFAPKLSLKLLGSAKRTAHPALKATLRMNGIGEASIARAQVTLPKSEFLDQGHLNNICTRVEFKEGAGNGANCPAASVYGHARAVTPILSEPLEGPVYLRSNGGEHKLPDLVAALHGQEINVDLVGRIDSMHGPIRTTFEAVPDAPVTSFTLEMQGGSKGLLINSTNLCQGKHRAIVDFTGHNGKLHDFNPAVGARCRKPHRKGKHRHG